MAVTHHRNCSGWWNIDELCWGKNTDMVLSKQGGHQAVDRKRKKSILGAALAAFCCHRKWAKILQ